MPIDKAPSLHSALSRLVPLLATRRAPALPRRPRPPELAALSPHLHRDLGFGR
jgi:hypothetical protein